MTRLTGPMQKELIEAYMGRFEIDQPTAIERIRADNRATHLMNYCEWNGIMNWSSRLYAIATEDFPKGEAK